MIGIVGIIVVFAMVFGGYLLAGGKMAIIMKSLPYELMMIGGAATGAFLIANSGSDAKAAVGSILRVFKGPKWKPGDYRDLLCLLFDLTKLAKQNPVELEEHIEAPGASAIFSNYPRIVADHEAIELICDTLRSASMNYNDPHQVEEVLEKRLDAQLSHAQHSAHALQVVADGLPALGIVAAVLGVIKTMSSIDQPPEILGKLIGGALVGTFLGVFLSYGLVGPLSNRLSKITEEDHHFYQLIREVLIANLHNHATGICIEVGRQNVPHHLRPTFSELEEALKAERRVA